MFATAHFIIFAIFITRASGHELYDAIRVGEISEVIKLVNRKPSLVNYETKTFGPNVTISCPLLAAIRENREDIAVFLIKRGADVDKLYGERTFLHLAIRARMAKAVEQILEKGVDVRRRIEVKGGRGNENTRRDRRQSRYVDRWDPTKCENREIFYTTYLHEAINLKEAAIVRLICDKNPDLNYVDHTDSTPLQAAIRSGCGKDIVSILLKAGSNVNKPNGSGVRAIHLALENYGREDGADIVELISDQRNFRVEATDFLGYTPLMKAAILNNAEAFELLLTKGANVRTRVENDETILHHRESCQNEAMITLAKSYGYDLECADGKGNTPFLFAAQSRIADGMNVLAKHGANVNAVNERRVSALHFTVEAADHSEEMLEILLYYGVDLDVPAKMGKPLNLGIMAERERVERLALNALFEAGFVLTDQQVAEFFRDYYSLSSEIARSATFANFQELFFEVAKAYLIPFNVIHADLFYLVKEYENKGIFTLYKILKRFYNVKGPIGELEIGKLNLLDEALMKITKGTYLERFPSELSFDIVMNNNYYGWKLERLSFNVAFACYNMNLNLNEGEKLITRVIYLNIL